MKAFRCIGGAVEPGIVLAPRTDDPLKKKLMIDLGEPLDCVGPSKWVAVSRNNKGIVTRDDQRILLDGHKINGQNGPVIVQAKSRREDNDDAVMVELSYFHDLVMVEGRPHRLIGEGTRMLLILPLGSIMRFEGPTPGHGTFAMSYTDKSIGLQCIPNEFAGVEVAGAGVEYFDLPAQE